MRRGWRAEGRKGKGGKAVNSHPRIRCEHLIFAPVVSFIDSSHVGACEIFKNAISHFLLPFQHSRLGPIWSSSEMGGQCLTPDLPFSAEDALPALTAKQVAVPPVWDTHLIPKASASLPYLSGLKEISLLQLSYILHRNH